MAKQEVKVDLWVAKQLDEAEIKDYDPQGSDIPELNEALKTASKTGKGGPGYPEYVAVVKDFVIVIENKANQDFHIKLNDDGVVELSDIKAVRDYAVNGALHYARHISTKSEFTKVFAIAVSGGEKRHRITPFYVDDRGEFKQLDDIESFIWFNESNIYEYYTRHVLEEVTDYEKTTKEILKDAAELHEKLRTFGTLKDQDKPLVVSGILLALDEVEYGNFSIASLQGDKLAGSRDGDKIMAAIKARLTRSNVGPDAKRDKLLREFAVITDSVRLNEVNPTLGKTPLKYYTEFLNKRVFQAIKYQQTSEDFIGRFYGEFMSYSGGDGQSLGIILTPKHMTDLMVDLVDVRPDDIVLDPTCGTAGFLIAAMHKMLHSAESDSQRRSIKKKQLHGFEIQPNMFAIAATNMILRHDGNSNIQAADFLSQNPADLQLQKHASVGLMNPPYSQGKDDPNQYEILFTEHLLDSMTEEGRVAVIIPQSCVTNKTKIERQAKQRILKRHTLEGVITCNPNTFYGVGTHACIAIFTAGVPHPPEHEAKFIDFRDDGFVVRSHIGLIEGDTAKDKRQHLLDVWNGLIESPSEFCVSSTVLPTDEWLHSFYYYNDVVPEDELFEIAFGEFLSFQFSMIVQNRGYLFASTPELNQHDIPKLSEKDWAEFPLNEVFSVKSGVRLTTADKIPGQRPFIGASDNTNGVTGFVSNENASLDSNVLGVNYNGAPCIAFYHPYEAIFTDDVKRLKLLHHDNNALVLLFCKVVIMQQRAKYSYGYKFNAGRMARQLLMFPVTDVGDIDYEYMEKYAENMLLRKYRQYSDYLASLLETDAEED